MLSSLALAEYAIFDLNALSETYYGCANSINDYCDIAGYCSPSEADQSYQLPFIWSETGGLKQLAGGYGVATCTSDHRVAGGFLKGKNGRIATMWVNSTGAIYEQLPGLTGPHAQVNSIGLSGHVCGQATVRNGASIEYVPCLWDEENRNIVYFVELELTPNEIGGYTIGYTTSVSFETFSTCIPINGAGNSANLILSSVNISSSGELIYTRILGGSTTSTETAGFVVTDNVVTNDSTATYADGNFVDQICGTALVGGFHRAFCQTGSTRTLLALYPGDTDNYALAINNPMNSTINMCGAPQEARNFSSADIVLRNSSQIVGYSTSAAGICHAFVWNAAKGMEFLPDLGGGSACAKDINEYGEICGWATDENGRTRAVLWRPLRAI